MSLTFGIHKHLRHVQIVQCELFPPNWSIKFRKNTWPCQL